MVIWNAEDRSATVLDYRERAPGRATPEMYLPGDDGAPAGNSQQGGLACAIPGNVAGLCYAQKNLGKLDLPTVLAPAIRLAREGVPLDSTAVRHQRATLAALERLPNGPERFATLRKLYLNEGRPVKVGERFYSPLADVLTRIAESGPQGFYQGEVGAALIAEVERQGGIWTTADLADPDSLVIPRKPLLMPLGDLDVYTMPPPSSGGVALLEMLNILGAQEAKQPAVPLVPLGHNSPEYLHRVAEASQHAFADRATYLGDADFVKVPTDRLISPEYAARLAEKFDPRLTHPAEHYGRAVLPDDSGTSHLSVMDAAGNAVACTETINLTFGSFVVEPRFGVILNNEMDDFTAQPGVPNAFGLIQSSQNAVAPKKKPLSSMTPTIAVRDGRAVLAVGASGGPRIISGTMQVLLNITRFGMTPSDAVAAPRIHHQWSPHVLQLEPALQSKAAPALQSIGHELRSTSGVAVVQVVTRDAAGLHGASDPRKGGRPAGW